MGSDNYSGEGRGADSPSESRGGPGSGAGSSSSGSSKGSSPSSGGNNGGLGGPTSNNSGNSGKSSPSKGSSSSGGGLNSAGNRASGAGPGASGNRSTTGGGFGGNSNANGGGSGGMGGGLNSAGNRASGAGPGASANRSTTGGGFGSQNSPGMGGMVSDAARRADLAQSARASENASMSTYNAARSLSQQNAQRADMAQQARTAENASMSTYDAQRRADMAQQQRASENASMKTINDQQRAFMGTISGTESPDYNVMYGGKTFSSYAAHPNVATTITSGPNKGKKSTAAGKYQFTKSTWDDQAAKLGLKDFSPLSQDAAAFNLAKESYKQKTGRSLTADLAAGVDAGKIASALSGSWTSLPGGIEATTTQGRFSREYAANLSKQNGTPETSRFASTYMGGKTATRTAQQNDPSGLPAGTYRGYDPSGLPADTPAAGPVPTNRPQQPRSLGQKVAAGAIDVGLGMLPGVGTAVSVINGGLALTGNRTLGERAVDSFSNGEGGAGPNSGVDRSGRGGGDKIVAENKDKSTVPEKQESFEDRYLKFVDPTKRPTPAERWDYNTPGYS